MSDLSGNEDIPEYRNITNENMYEFMIWANERRDKSIPVDHFNMIIQANITNWIQENNITWPSFWDGERTGGPIATAWAVRGWPTIYIIDAKGVIRFKNTRGKAMDEAVDSLLKEIESD